MIDLDTAVALLLGLLFVVLSVIGWRRREKRLEDEWDRQIEADAKAGKLDKLADQALEDYKEGKVRDL